MPYSLPIARQTDRVVAKALVDICNEVTFPAEVKLLCLGVDDAMNVEAPPSQVMSNESLQQVFDLLSSVIRLFRLSINGHEILAVSRPDNTVHDTLTFNWQSARQFNISPAIFTKLVALAKEKLREFRVDSQNSATADASFDAAAKVRFSELAELQQIASELTVKAHDHFAELDRRFTERVAEFKVQNDKDRAEAEAAIDAEKAKLVERQKALDEREAQIDRSDAKSARRKLRENLRTTLREHSQRFELSKTTRGLRLPTAILLTAILAATGWLTFRSFIDVSEAVIAANVDWWRIAILAIKQIFYAATFLGFAAYTLRWFDSWSRRHADAEFRFKQLELDVDRASWVVEVAQEWHKDQGTEVPPELLAQLSNHLFGEAADVGELETHDGLAALLGAAARLKLTSPAGELEIDKRGLRQLKKDSDR